MKVELFEKMTNVFTNGPCIGVDLPFEREEIFLHASENELAEAMREYRQDHLLMQQVSFHGAFPDEPQVSTRKHRTELAGLLLNRFSQNIAETLITHI
jgi:hypothetical protein